MDTTNIAGWFEIYVDSMERAAGFYQTVLGTTLTDMSDPTDSGMQMMNFPMDETMSKYGAPGALVKMDGFGPGVGGTLIYYFAVEDCAVEESRVASAGGEVVKPKRTLGEFGWMSLCQDTEGNVYCQPHALLSGCA